jgi:hypothetical protein
MKRIQHISIFIVWALITLSFTSVPLKSQNSYTGSWEGMFMSDYRTVIQLDYSDEKGYSGKILMYDGTLQIQDDQIFKIQVKENRLTFYIQAKETHYEGTFNEDITELSGIFIFPDGSEHALTAKKEPKDNNT